MDTTINNIMVPVDLEEHSLSALQHAAALASKNGATIHLLHVISNSAPGLVVSSGMHFALPYTFEKTKQARYDTLEHWKAMLQLRNGVRIKIILLQGNPARQVSDYAEKNEIDFIVLGMNEQRKWLSRLFGSTAKHLTRSLKIPVMTIFHKPESIFKWKNVVLPITNFLPEKRVRAILNFAMLHSIKIHFVAISKNVEQKKSENFHLLLESLKLVKAFGNIPVECKSLNGNNLLNAAWDYASDINADAIMVNAGTRTKLLAPPTTPSLPGWYESLFVNSFATSF